MGGNISLITRCTDCWWNVDISSAISLQREPGCHVPEIWIPADSSSETLCDPDVLGVGVGGTPV